jgi:hypothetical protein
MYNIIMEQLPTGVWVHYKDLNREYRVICVALTQMKQEELDHQPVVVYEALYEVTDPKHKYWVRPLVDFLEVMDLPDGDQSTRFIKVRD